MVAGNLAPTVDEVQSGAGASPAANYAPPTSRLRVEAATPRELCEPVKVKYVVLRSKKVPGSDNEEMEEVEEVGDAIAVWFLF